MATRSEPGLTDYLKSIKEFELLTPEEERDLGGRIQAASGARSRLESGEISLDEFSRLQRDSAEARDEMIQANLRLVISVAKNFRNRGLPLEDLINEGNLGLVNAVDRFDPEVGSRFSTYASYWIDQAIRRAIQTATQMIHIPSYLMDQISQMRLAMRDLEEELGRQPSIEEIATHLDVTPRRASAIAKALKACACPTQGLGSGEDESGLADALPDTRMGTPEDHVLSESDREFVAHLLSCITEREAEVLRLRYGLRDQREKTMTLKEIGEAVGLTRERVRQIEKEARSKLADYFSDYE